jgi:hypothetical protein
LQLQGSRQAGRCTAGLLDGGGQAGCDGVTGDFLDIGVEACGKAACLLDRGIGADCGGASVAQRSIEAVTTTKSPSAAESREVYTNEGDADGAVITLPTAAAGLEYTFVVQAAQTLTITAGAGDTIGIAGSVTAAAGSISSNVVRSSVTLLAVNATEWVATSAVGTWSF